MAESCSISCFLSVLDQQHGSTSCFLIRKATQWPKLHVCTCVRVYVYVCVCEHLSLFLERAMDSEAVREENALCGPGSEERSMGPHGRSACGEDSGLCSGGRSSHPPCGWLFGRQDVETRFVQSKDQAPDAVTDFPLSAVVTPQGRFQGHSWTQTSR